MGEIKTNNTISKTNKTNIKISDVVKNITLIFVLGTVSYVSWKLAQYIRRKIDW